MVDRYPNHVEAVYELMELIFPRLIELRPLENEHDLDDFNSIQESAERIWEAGYRRQYNAHCD